MIKRKSMQFQDSVRSCFIPLLPLALRTETALAASLED
jgi:hypothetical protein